VGDRQREGIGFLTEADGIAIHLDPDCLSQSVDLGSRDVARLRVDYYRERLRLSSSLPANVSVFERDWLWQMSVAMLTATAAKMEVPLETAQEALATRRPAAAAKVLDSIFQMREVEVVGGEQEGRLKRRLETLWQQDSVQSVIEELEALLWSPLGDDFVAWVGQRCVATLAEAIRSATISVVPDMAEDALSLDVTHGEDGGSTIYLTETESGGTGVVERIVGTLRSSPTSFNESVRHHLSWCPRDHVARTLEEVVDWSVRSGDDRQQMRNAFRTMRAAEAMADVEKAHAHLCKALDDVGFTPTREITVALTSRFLQPGTSEALEALVSSFAKRRASLSAQLGVEVPPEAFCYHALQVSELREALAKFLEGISAERPRDAQVYTIAQRMVLHRCEDSCLECLDQWNPFGDFGRPSRRLAAIWLGLEDQEIVVEGGDEWVAQAKEVLAGRGRVVVTIEGEALAVVVPKLQGLLAEELPVEYLLVPVTIARIERSGRRWKVVLELKEIKVG